MNLTDVEKEQVGVLKNEMTHLWTGMFIFGGGGLSLMITHPSPSNYFWGAVGTFWAVVFLISYFIKRDKLKEIVFKN
jgi:hypothetical protein